MKEITEALGRVVRGGRDAPRCPSCGVRYVEHAGLHGTCKALQTVTAERDRLAKALLAIAEQFPPGEERRTYGDVTKTLDRIRETARGVIDPAA